MNAEERFLNRFRSEFQTGDLANIKFFVKAERMSVSELFEQALRFEVAAHEGNVRIVETLDKGFPRHRFDSPFV